MRSNTRTTAGRCLMHEKYAAMDEVRVIEFSLQKAVAAASFLSFDVDQQDSSNASTG